MAIRPRRTATSYDEILRFTVANPDLSFRPSREDERLSRHRFGEATEHRPRSLTAFEQRLLTRVIDALLAHPILDVSEVEIAVVGSEVILFGTVPGPGTAIRIEEVVGAVEGVLTVDNELLTRSPRA
jgi:hypothetical protein